MESVQQLVGGVPESFAVAELDRRDGDVHRVDEVGVEEFADGCNATTEAHVLAVGGVRRLSQRFGGRGVEEVERGVGQGERRAVWWVRTNTGVWNGGVSPHQPFQS